MARTFLASFRGTDGRSLTRAMAVLLVVSGCFGAIHSGRMADAAVTSAFVICSSDAAGTPVSGGPSLPWKQQQHCLCCVLGCSNAAACALPVAVGLLASMLDTPDSASLVQTASLPAETWRLTAGPRGPPVLN